MTFLMPIGLTVLSGIAPSDIFNAFILLGLIGQYISVSIDTYPSVEHSSCNSDIKGLVSMSVVTFTLTPSCISNLSIVMHKLFCNLIAEVTEVTEVCD